MDFSRRDLLKGSAALGLGFLVQGMGSLAYAREPEFKFPTRPIDRLALTSYPFRAYMDDPHNAARQHGKPLMDIPAFARMAIEKFGIHNINPLIAHFRSTDTRYLEKVRKGVHKAGSRFVDLGLGGGMFFDPDPSVRQGAIAAGKHWIDVARILGSPSVRQHLHGRRGVKPSVELGADSLNKLADYGAKRNVVVNLENDSLVYEDPFLIVKIINKAGNPYLRALPDFGNTLQKGDPAYAYRGLVGMFKHVFDMSHVKDEITRPGKVYRVNLPKVFGIAKAAGYRGFFSMEWDTGSGDPYMGTHRLVKETLHYLS